MDEELQGVNATAEGEAQAPAQEQTPAKSEDVEQVVNRLLETRLATEVERRVQSELQKRKNRADKQLAEEKRVIERMAQRGLDEDTKKQYLEAAERDAETYRAVWHFEDEETTSSEPAPPQSSIAKSSEPSSPNQPDVDTAFRNYVKTTYGFDPKAENLAYTELLSINDPQDSRVLAFQRKALQLGAKLAEAQERRQRNAEEVAEDIDAFGHTGGLSRGNPASGGDGLEHVTDREELAQRAADEEWKTIKRR